MRGVVDRVIRKGSLSWIWVLDRIAMEWLRFSPNWI